jgi:ABC-type bacteriocin/lantibiotic exporter with double-glycine peptidase domain
MWPWLCLAAAALLLGGCAAAGLPVVSAEMQVIPGVPAFQEQARGDDCAGVALASLLGHAGISVAPAAIDAAVYDPRLGGALLPDLEQFAVAVGARPRSGRGSVTELRTLLGAGVPVLVPIDLGWGPWRRPHYVVLFGFNEHSFWLHLRAQETISMTVTEFERRWSVMGRLRLYLEQ